MNQTLKPVCFAVTAMAFLYADIAATPTSAAPTGVALPSAEIVHTKPCSPIVSLTRLVPIVATISVDPATIIQQGEDEGEDDDWDFNVECEGAVSVSAKADDGKITVKTCSVEGAVECTLSNDDADFDITLEGCITVTHESQD